MKRLNSMAVLRTAALTAGLCASAVAALGVPTFVVDTTDDSVATSPAASPKDSLGRVSLRSAVMASNAQGGAVIELQPAATYKLTLVPPASDVDLHDDATGDLDIRAPLTINGQNAVIDGNAIDRVFSIESTGDVDFPVSMQNLTVANGAPKGFQRAGGGINVRAATLNLTNCIVKGCTTANTTGPANGGGIAANGVNHFPGLVPATLNLTGCTVSGNTGNNGGGIVVGDSAVTLDACVVSNNTATGVDPGSGGGGLFLTGSSSVANIRNGTQVSGNTTASEGGGISVFSGLLYVRNSTVAGNKSRRSGGGIANSAVSPGTINVNGSTISGNDSYLSVDFAGDGGGIFSPGSCTVTNSTLSGNHGHFGGGVFGTAALNSVTITGNSAAAGGGLYLSSGTVLNSIVAGNTAAGGGPDGFGVLPSGGYNLIGSTAGLTIGGTTTGNILNVNPQLGPLAYNGGQTLTHALLAGSPAIDAGTLSGFPAIDQRGVARPQLAFGPPPARCDIGAFEFVLPYSVNDAAKALSIAGGLTISTPDDRTRLDLVGADGRIRLEDAVRAARRATGLDP